MLRYNRGGRSVTEGNSCYSFRSECNTSFPFPMVRNLRWVENPHQFCKNKFKIQIFKKIYGSLQTVRRLISQSFTPIAKSLHSNNATCINRQKRQNGLNHFPQYTGVRLVLAHLKLKSENNFLTLEEWGGKTVVLFYHLGYIDFFFLIPFNKSFTRLLYKGRGKTETMGLKCLV